jgi:hypothetical protein
MARRNRKEDPAEHERERERRRAQRRAMRGFSLHLAIFMTVALIAFVANVLFVGDNLWTVYILGGWGVIALAHFLNASGLLPFMDAEWEQAVMVRLGWKPPPVADDHADAEEGYAEPAPEALPDPNNSARR